MASFPPITARPPRRIASEADVVALRAWAFSSLGAGRGREVIAALHVLDEDAVPGQSWADAWTELNVRVGIALDDRDLVMTAAIELAGGGVSQLAPPALLAVGLGAAWLVEDASRREGPWARFGDSRPWLTAARWTLARVLSRGELDSSSAEEGVTALDGLYASVWREREPVLPVGSAGGRAGVLGDLWEALSASRGSESAAQLAVAAEVTERVAAAYRAAWTGPATDARDAQIDGELVRSGARVWWWSSRFQVWFEVTAPGSVEECHRFALADVFLELEELARVPLALEDARVRALTAAHQHELARHAVAHAAWLGLVPA